MEVELVLLKVLEMLFVVFCRSEDRPNFFDCWGKENLKDVSILSNGVGKISGPMVSGGECKFIPGCLHLIQVALASGVLLGDSAIIIQNTPRVIVCCACCVPTW